MCSNVKLCICCKIVLNAVKLCKSNTVQNVVNIVELCNCLKLYNYCKMNFQNGGKVLHAAFALRPRI